MSAPAAGPVRARPAARQGPYAGTAGGRARPQSGPAGIRTPRSVNQGVPTWRNTLRVNIKKTRKRNTKKMQGGKTTPDPHKLLQAHSNLGKPLPVPGVIGNFLCLDMSRKDTIPGVGLPTDGSEAKSMIVVLCWTPSSVKGFYTRSTDYYVWPLMMPQFETDVPQNVRPMRNSCRVRNITRADAVEGVVRVLNSTESLDFKGMFDPAPGIPVMNVNFYQRLATMCNTDAKSKSYSAHELTTTHDFVCGPSHLEGMQRWTAGINVDPATLDYFTKFQEALTAAEHHGEALSTVIFHFPATSQAQLYDFGFYAQDAATYPANSLGSVLQRTVPPGANHGHFHNIASAVQQGMPGRPAVGRAAW